jgi:luciferase family oxidoreductase group 1
VGDALANSVALAQRAEEFHYSRVWYAEHHNFDAIGSAATSLVIAHMAAHTSHIRLGAGGIMLPNHSPLVIAEQFGTLEALYPGRIDLGLGRAPGTDQKASLALRRPPEASSRFADDVLELQAYLGTQSIVPGVEATPGKGSAVPLYILGSSMFGARLAAALGLPYAFGSHFAPEDLEDAVAAYRNDFRPSRQLDEPYVMAGVNVIASDSAADAQAQFELAKRNRARALFGRDRALTEEEIDGILGSFAGRRVEAMVTYSAVGTSTEVGEYVRSFARHARADELITVHQSPTTEGRARSVELLAECMD